MRRHLIDHHGNVWTDPAPGLGDALGYPDPDFDLWNYAIRNLGAVEIVIGDDEAVVSLRTATAKPMAVKATEQFLATLGPMQVRLRYEIGAWIEESCNDPLQAAKQLTLALTDASRVSSRVAFAAKTRRLEMLSDMRLNQIETPEDKLSLLFKKWRLSQGSFTPETASFLVRFGLLDRTAVIGEADNGELTFEHSGAAFRAYEQVDENWNFRAKGVRLSDQPDPDYGRWVDRTYRGVLNEIQPRFEYVDAVIQARQGEPYRSRYDRLLLPWHTPAGKRLVTGTSYQSAQPGVLVHQ